MTAKMHDDEFDTSVDLVRSLLAAQLPGWSDLPIRAVTSTGTSNAMYRLGEDMVVRLPLRPGSEKSLAKEHTWLPVLAPDLPVRIPVPLAAGAPTADYPMPWSVLAWVAGEDGIIADFDREAAALDLARFIKALQAIDTTGAPTPSAANLGRGVPLADRDRYTRESIAACAHVVDAPALEQVWEQSLQAPSWDRPAVWVHGDLASGNILFEHRRLSAVIDWSPCGIGDPAVDVMVAWEMFTGPSRRAFRAEVEVDDATWERARGWALSTAVGVLPYYEDTNQFMVDQALHKISAVLHG